MLIKINSLKLVIFIKYTVNNNFLTTYKAQKTLTALYFFEISCKASVKGIISIKPEY